MMKFFMPEMISYSAACMSILRTVNIRQTQPLAVVCNNLAEQDTIIQRMKIFSKNRKHTLRDFLNIPLRYLGENKDDILFLQCISDSQEELLFRISEMLANGYCENEQINCLICVLFTGYIPENYIDYFSVIIPNCEIQLFLQNKFEGQSIQNMLIKRKELFSLLDAIKTKSFLEMVDNSMCSDEELFYAAAEIRSVLCNATDEREERFNIVKEKLQMSVDMRDNSDVPALFVGSLYKHLYLFYPILSIHEANSELSDRKYVLYDDEAYYLPEAVMNILLNKMSEYAGATEIKRLLAQAGYIETQGKSRLYYTQKLVVGGRRLHYYKLKRENIDQVGEATLATICELKEEDQHDIGEE